MHTTRRFRDGTAYVTPVGSCGDVGAASGVLGCVLAVEAAALDGPQTLNALVAALERPERRAAGLYALGFTGQLDAVEACLRHLDDQHRPTARWALEAVSHITGLSIADDRFARPPKPSAKEQQTGPTDDDDLVEDLTLAPTEGLPDPSADGVRAWWAERRSSFDARQRYLRGQPFSPAALEASCASWTLHRSGPIALEIAARTGGACMCEGLRLEYPRLTGWAAFAPLLSRLVDWR